MEQGLRLKDLKTLKDKSGFYSRYFITPKKEGGLSHVTN